MNIWTHLLGALYLIIWYFLIDCDEALAVVSSDEKKILKFVLFTGTITFTCSALFHIMECHSPRVRNVFQRLDHAGIAVALWGSQIGFVQSTSLERDPNVQSYIIMASHVISLIVISLQLSGFFRLYPGMRTCLFVTSASFFFVGPIIEVLSKYGLKMSIEIMRIDLMSEAIIAALVGIMFYLLQIPERFNPGKYDNYLQGHSIFHVCIYFTLVLAAESYRQSAINRHNWMKTKEEAIPDWNILSAILDKLT